MQRLALEWLHRLLSEPQRLAPLPDHERGVCGRGGQAVVAGVRQRESLEAN